MMHWDTLFAARAGEATRTVSVPMRFVCRHGRPLLLLPMERSAAVQALTLYPAQSLLAKAAKALLHLAITARFPLLFRRTMLPVAREGAFAQFVTQTAATDSFPKLAILAGNPDALGQRLILLLFDADGRPSVVVKAGMGAAACRLIEKERGFLEAANASGARPSITPLKGAYRNGDCSTIALPFLKGRSPACEDWAGVGNVLSGWLHQETAPLRGIPAWQQLSVEARRDPAWEPLVRSLELREVHPAVFHGDFAPWNVRMTPSEPWIALDWERGELTGVPGWDWFHWLVHVSLLVFRHDTPSSLAWIEQTLRNSDFTAYSKAAKIKGIEFSLLAAYLFYLHKWIVPDVIKAPIAQLRDAVAKKLEPAK